MLLKQRFYLIMLSIILVILMGSTGYYILFGNQTSFMDCLYMTVISLTTVGYGEILNISGNTGAKIFTMVLITFGMGIILYGISTLTAIILEGELSGILRKKKMTRKISSLTDHYIVCGGGETGRSVLLELKNNHEPVVLIEKDEDMVKKAGVIIEDLLFVTGDATEDENILDAGIDHAKGIIITLPSDKDNLYITMTARMLNTGIRIISRMTDENFRPKLYKAGANGVVSPNAIGALRLASEMIRPTVVNFLDSMLRSNSGNLRINQLLIGDDSKFVGRKLMDTGLKETFHLLVLGLKEENANIIFDPPPQKELKPNTTIIVMGEVNDFTRAKKYISERHA